MLSFSYRVSQKKCTKYCCPTTVPCTLFSETPGRIQDILSFLSLCLLVGFCEAISNLGCSRGQFFNRDIGDLNHSVLHMLTLDIAYKFLSNWAKVYLTCILKKDSAKGPSFGYNQYFWLNLHLPWIFHYNLCIFVIFNVPSKKLTKICMAVALNQG